MPTSREIGALVVDMRADTTQFVRGMTRSARSLRATETRMEGLRKSASGLAVATVALTAGGFGLTSVARRYAELGSR